MKTEESNALIAAFMNEIIEKNYVVKLSYGNKCVQNPEGKMHFPMSYDTSWDWLMPVLEKIETINDCRYRVIMHFATTYIIDDALEPEETIVRSSEANRLNSVYEAVIKFIQLYNKTQQP